MAAMPAASVDAIVCDPPYHLTSIVKRFGNPNSAPAQYGTDGVYARSSKGFMGKVWDGGDVAFQPEIWAAALRVAKPGAHLLAFGGTRTFHRLAVAIEDAGWEIRDTVMWVYGSGFPKSHDVGKGIDKRGGSIVGFEQFRDAVKDAMKRNGVSRYALTESLGNHMLSHYLTAGSQPAIPNLRDYYIIRDTVGLGGEFDEMFNNEAERAAVTTRKAADLFEAEREVANKHITDMGGLGGERLGLKGGNITAPSTAAARQWDGWGTALKPAWEPIIVARKPLEGTVAANVLAHGTGALNIDGCRVDLVGIQKHWENYEPSGKIGFGGAEGERTGGAYNDKGRWPANVIHDGSDEVLAGFPVNAGAFAPVRRGHSGKSNGIYGDFAQKGDDGASYRGDTGSAARFFYCAKASKADRDEGCEGMQAKQYSHDGRETPIENAYQRNDSKSRNHHPTVKPTALMRYLCKLVTPPAGTVLDPFMGSGSTGKAARMDGFGFIGIEQDADYIAIARARIAHAVQSPAQQPLHI